MKATPRKRRDSGKAKRNNVTSVRWSDEDLREIEEKFSRMTSPPTLARYVHDCTMYVTRLASRP